MIDGNGNIIPLDMPEKFIAEMVADWASVEGVRGELYSKSADWYHKNVKNMILSQKTIKSIEDFLEMIL